MTNESSDQTFPRLHRPEDEVQAAPSRRKRARAARPLTLEEIRDAIDPQLFPPILNAKQAAALLQRSINTIYKAVSEGRYRDAVRRGKPLVFWRDRLIQIEFGG